MFKKLLSMVLCVVLALSAVGCSDGLDRGSNGNAGKNGTLKITYYKGGTGDEWIETIARDFEKATNIKVELTADAKATQNALVTLESNRNLPDLMFILYTNWCKFVQNDYLEPLGDLYNGEFSATYGDTTITSKYDVTGTTLFAADASKGNTDLTLEDVLDSGYNSYGYTSQTSDSEKDYWIMPWTSGTTGIVYNVDMLKSVGYDNPPATYDELLDCCNKLKEKGIAPFAWGGQEIGYWDFVVQGWWAQYSGVDKWQDFFQFESADVFKDEGRVKALEAFKKLLVDENGEWTNSVSAPMGRDHMEAAQQFVKGEAAMTPTGSWIETEIGEFLPEDFNMAIMPTPVIEGAQTDENGNPIQVCNTEAGDFACIPKNADNVEAAKAFLAFMNQPKYVEMFTKTTGMPRPFNYKPSTIEGITDFTKSCMTYYEDSVKMWRVSDSPIYFYAGIGIWEPLGATTVYANLQSKSAVEVCDMMSQNAEKKWDTWLKMVQ